MSAPSREVSDGVSVSMLGQENVILKFKESPTDNDPYLWGFPSRDEFGTFVARLQAYFTEVTA
jgi:hypothetical protein